LSDGRIVVAERTEEYRRVSDPGAGFRSGWLFQNASVSATLPAPLNRAVSWSGTLLPIALDIQPDKVAYLVCVVATGSGRIEWKLKDDERYVPFKLTSQGWERIAFEALPRSVEANLLGVTETLFIKQQARSGLHLDLKAKAKLNEESTVGRSFKMILRPPVGAATGGNN
jgi:hypothetical protein